MFTSRLRQAKKVKVQEYIKAVDPWTGDGKLVNTGASHRVVTSSLYDKYVEALTRMFVEDLCLMPSLPLDVCECSRHAGSPYLGCI